MQVKYEYCCERFKTALREDLIRRTDRHGNYHLTPTEAGVSDSDITYCPFCGRALKPWLREIQDAATRALAGDSTGDFF